MQAANWNADREAAGRQGRKADNRKAGRQRDNVGIEAGWQEGSQMERQAGRQQ